MPEAQGANLFQRGLHQGWGRRERQCNPKVGQTPQEKYLLECSKVVLKH